MVRRGSARAVVTHTGDKTYIGQAAKWVESTEQTGELAKVAMTIASFLIKANIFALMIAFTVMMYRGDSIVGYSNYL